MPITAPIAFTIESYHSIVRSLPECSSKAVGTCKCIVTFLSNSFGKQKRTGRFAKFWREQTSLLWHLHHGDTLTFVLGPLLLTTPKGLILWLLLAAKLRPDILPAVQHAHDQDAIGLLLVKHDVAAMSHMAKASFTRVGNCADLRKPTV
jgi:hypothetical protein